MYIVYASVRVWAMKSDNISFDVRFENIIHIYSVVPTLCEIIFFR